MALITDEQLEAHKPTTCEACGGTGEGETIVTDSQGQKWLRSGPCPQCDPDGRRYGWQTPRILTPYYADRRLRSYIGKDGRSK